MEETGGYNHQAKSEQRYGYFADKADCEGPQTLFAHFANVRSKADARER